jgi:hypothetical protein
MVAVNSPDLRPNPYRREKFHCLLVGDIFIMRTTMRRDVIYKKGIGAAMSTS